METDIPDDEDLTFMRIGLAAARVTRGLLVEHSKTNRSGGDARSNASGESEKCPEHNVHSVPPQYLVDPDNDQHGDRKKDGDERGGKRPSDHGTCNVNAVRLITHSALHPDGEYCERHQRQHEYDSEHPAPEQERDTILGCEKRVVFLRPRTTRTVGTLTGCNVSAKLRFQN